MIIGLSGYAQAGKDTAGAHLVRDLGFQRRAFADKVREAVYALDPVVGYHIESPVPGLTYYPLHDLINWYGYEKVKANSYQFRELLQRMGTEVGRKMIDDDIWVKLALDGVNETDDIVVTDVRFPNEARAITRHGGYVIRIHRPGTRAVNRHISETALDDWDFDAYAQNDGTVDELNRQVLSILAEFGHAGAAESLDLADWDSADLVQVEDLS